MGEFLVLCFLLIPQTVAAVYAKSMNRNPWFWFFISFAIPIISLVILLVLDQNKGPKKKSYQLAEHVKQKSNTN